jgi:hypothetical protein
LWLTKLRRIGSLGLNHALQNAPQAQTMREVEESPEIKDKTKDRRWP